MTQEDKNLLLIDLCARLPYGVIVKMNNPNYLPSKLTTVNIETELVELNTIRDVPLGTYKPYLRPLSSMTEEEKEELAFIRDRDFQSVRKWINDESIKETRNICPITYGEVDFCNKKHLDYRGLIEKGLAIKVTEENNPYKE